MTTPQSTQKLDFDAKRLTGTIGVEVAGLSLRHADDAQFARLRRLISENCVAVIREQFLTAAEMAALGPQLGPVAYTPGLIQNTEFHNVYRVENAGKDKIMTEVWHTDAPYSARPAAFTALSMSVMPPAGGDTLFINQYISYERLSEGFKRMLRGLRLKHVARFQDLRYFAGDSANIPSGVHPIVRMHPDTGRRALYINVPHTIDEMIGFAAHEFRMITDFLYNHSIAIDRMYRHRWAPGDVVIWDNRCTLHAAAHDYGNHERVLYRVMSEGEEPSEGTYDDDASARETAQSAIMLDLTML